MAPRSLILPFAIALASAACGDPSASSEPDGKYSTLGAAVECDDCAVAVTGGGQHTCALLDDGAVRCWGYNTVGQLGLGDTAHRGDEIAEMGADLRAVKLGSGRTAVAIQSGYEHSCALLDNGRVKCWGRGVTGQLGNGVASYVGDQPNEMGNDLPPINLGAGRTATAIAAGGYHTCAVLDDRSLKCWGFNGYGQLGRGDTNHRGDEPGELGNDLAPINLGAGRTATAVAAGSDHTCALLDNGRVKCWGYNNQGQLGLGDTESRGDDPGEMGTNLPTVDLGATRTATAITAGDSHSCALLDNGRIKCWGYNGFAQLALGDTASRGDDPGEMGANLPAFNMGRPAVAVTAGALHTCGVFDNNLVRCWGYNGYGQLGKGTTDSVVGDVPAETGGTAEFVKLGNPETVIGVAAGGYHTCAVLENNRVKCWGNNFHGQLGLGDAAHRGDAHGEMGNHLLALDLD